jgi:hypothetical protein
MGLTMLRTTRSTMRLLLPALALAAVSMLACLGHTVPVEGAAPEPGDEDAERRQSVSAVAATLIVENARMVDYRIYLTRQGGERLGIVSGPGRVTFLLKGAQLPHTGELRVVAVPIADNEVLQSSAYLPRGHTAHFRIMPNGAYLVVDALPAPRDTTPADSASRPDSAVKPPR